MGDLPNLETQTGFMRTPPPIDARSALALGTVLDGRYVLERVLHSQSQFSIVYLAKDNELHRQVAIKEFFPRDYVVRASDATVAPESTQDKRPFDDAMAGFLEEGRKLANVHHEGIVDIYGAFKQNGTAYLVMERVVGETMADFRVRGNDVDAATFTAIFEKLVDALREVHALGIVHRDIKLNNIMIRTKGGQPVLIDFGAARQLLGAASRDFTRVFTPGFSPPEQTSQQPNQRPGPYSDLYSLAATLLAWVSGTTPPDANDRMSAKIDQQPDPMLRFSDLMRGRQFNPTMLDALDQCLELRIVNRPQSVDDLLARIKEVKVVQPPHKIPRPLILAGVIFVFILLLIYWEVILGFFGIYLYRK